MKNIFTKILTGFIVITVLAIGLKVGDNMLAKANASTNNICGVNNGWIWNGTQCVNTCDINHPWDPINKRCSTGYYYNNSNYYNSTNCAVYGSNFYFNGSSCVERVTKENANYYGNPFNGSTTVPVYGNYNYNYNYNYYTQTQNPTYTYTYPNTNYYLDNYYSRDYTNTPRIKESVIYYNTYTNNYNPTEAYNAIYHDSNYFGRKNIDYYIYTITTTTSQPKGTPIYLGSNPNYNYYNDYNSSNWYSYNYDYSYNSSYNNYNDYNYGWYTDGYYDIYGNYRW